MRIVDCFIEQCRRRPNACALQILRHDESVSEFTWAQLESHLFQAIEGLQDSAGGSLKAGDPVATCLPNGLSWILVDLACQWLGLLHVALDRRLPPKMATDLLAHSQARLLVVDDASQESISSLVPVVHASSFQLQIEPGYSSRELPGAAHTSAHTSAHTPAQLMYTSGTINRPKGAVLSHGNLLSNAHAKLAAAPQFEYDVRLNILPFAHAYARTCELSTWILSGSQLCIADSWESFLLWAPKVQPTLINLVPHLVYRLAECFNSSGKTRGRQLLGSRLRLLQVGGAALREDVWQQMADLGWPPLQGYGLTETSPVICSNRAGQQRCDSVGPPVEGVEVRVDSEGVLWTRGPHVMLGYWQDADATRARIQDGWFCTGDLGEQLEDGSWRILGRVDDQITLSTGYKVAPLELTRRLSADPWLESVVLVGQDQPFVAALVYPRVEKLPLHLTEVTCDGLVLNKEAFAEALIDRWKSLSSDLPRSMQIERVAVMGAPLTVANGGLNFKGAIRRRFIEQNLCRDEVEQLFKEWQRGPKSRTGLQARPSS